MHKLFLVFALFLISLGIRADGEKTPVAETWNEKAMSARENGVPSETVVALFRKGAEAGETAAMVNLAACALRGDGMKKDEKEALKYLESAAAKNDPVAMVNLGAALSNGIAGSIDSARAIDFYRRAAEAGNPMAHYLLGREYEAGKNIPCDYAAAMTHYQAASAEELLPEAENRIGMLHFRGRGVPSSDVEAMRHFARAATAGYLPAQNNAAFVMTHRRDGKPSDWKMAEALYLRAADAGYLPAQMNLANLYFSESGEKSQLSPEKAVHYWNLAAAQKDPRAFYFLGGAFRSGTGVAKDSAKAFENYKASAELGYPFACIALSELYGKGEGVKQDSEAARYWMEKSGIPENAKATSARESMDDYFSSEK